MYLRFVSPERAGRGRGAYGIFYAAGCAGRDHRNPDIVRGAIRSELDWFNANLPVPKGRHFVIKSKSCWYDEGICWFRAEARDMISHAWVLAALLRDCGVIINHLTTRDPGQILYRDDYQIVAKPGKWTPVAWG
jgi:hypothetical protein